MCEQCEAKTLNWDALPGWALVYARRKGSLMEKGEWGLLQCNDPVIIFSVRPVMDPCFGLTDAEIEAQCTGGQELEEAWHDSVQEFYGELAADPEDGWRLVEAARSVGYGGATIDISDEPINRPCAFYQWLFHHLGCVIHDNKPRDDYFCLETMSVHGAIGMREIVEAGRGIDPDVDEKLRLIDAFEVPELDKSPFATK